MAPQIVLMTGSSSGIGLVMAQRLARDPDHRFIVIATVIAMSEKNDLEAAVKDDIEKTVFIKELDITNDEHITEVVEDVISSHGRIDVLINIAGIALPAIAERVSREKIDKIFNVNVIGTIRLTQAVLPHMKEQQSGKIITFSSITGKIGFPYSEFYCASKFALEGFFESLAGGLRAFKIRVCLIEPTQVESALWDWILHQMESLANDQTLSEIDRRQNRITHARSKEGTRMPADDVVGAVITRCLDVDEPVLRHLLAPGETCDVLQKTLADLTGEAGISAFGF
ncbi:retinol dehydrogenase 8-like [Lytechinus pictus]|uniref:retinol dehydrogenase 8-like n=1 Tax=Lytechinus pictus TaxID=7653 RepID=UPI0030B9D9D9